MASIKPFKITISDEALADLHNRLANTRWPLQVHETNWERGVPLDYMQHITRYWQKKFDWRQAESYLNSFPQFTTEIDKQTIHFVHVQSKTKNATPILLCHGYPGSFTELLRVIKPLADAGFDVVAPSMPGLGFSTPVLETGWETARTAKAYIELMNRLGYEHYGLQGSDVGAGVCNEIALAAPDKVIGAHISTDPTAVAALLDLDKVDETKLDAAGKEKLAKLKAAKKDGGAYLRIQGTRPQTMAYGFNDSPVLQLAWIVERVQEWKNDAAQTPEDAIDLNTLLTHVSIYWFTQSGASSAHMIYNSQHVQGGWGMPTVPMGFAVFNTTPIVRLLIDPEHKNKHWTEFNEGGHFPGFEAHEALAKDITAFFASLT